MQETPTATPTATLAARGWEVLEAGPGGEPLANVIEALTGSGTALLRDVEIGSAGCPGDLVASPEEFAFHTDGVFWKLPPRWICIQVLRADGGGALHVLDLDPLADELRRCPHLWFGTGQGGLVGPVVADGGARPVIRYRRDYMHALEDTDTAKLAELHERVGAHAAAAERVGELAPGDCLVIDNWRLAHRREAFRGERRIRRLWFGAKASR
jgi:alpha-ketoglutarate-dependent taurine dioxygenase